MVYIVVCSVEKVKLQDDVKQCPTASLSLSHFSQSSDGRSDSGGSSSGNGVSTTSNGLLTGRTSPDTSSTSLDGLLTTERTLVSSVLLNFQLLDLSSQRGTVTDTVLTCDTDLLSSLSPVEWIVSNIFNYELERLVTLALGNSLSSSIFYQSVWNNTESL